MQRKLFAGVKKSESYRQLFAILLYRSTQNGWNFFKTNSWIRCWQRCKYAALDEWNS